MKKYFFYMMMIVAAAFATTSCNDDDDNSLDDWKMANEAAFNSIKNNPEYKELKSEGNEGSIYYKVLTQGTGTKPIYYSSTVNVYLKGWFVADYKEKSIEKGYVFLQKLFNDGAPVNFTVNSLTYGWNNNGWKTALQHMVEGDKWEIWIPYQLGYGASGYSSGNIPGYSTLAFELEVVGITGN